MENWLTRGEKQRISYLRKSLISWYRIYGRDFPWRKTDTSTYEKICTEVLLQRTRAEVVTKFYQAFFTRFKGWSDIAKVTIEDLESFLTPLGLWRRRARSIKALAKYASARAGKFPDSEMELSQVPAVGQYVSNAILLFQKNRRKPLLDVNMARVIERYLRKRRLADIRYDPWLQQAAHWLVAADNAAEVNWAILDLAATTCQSRHPRCSHCPLSSRCNHVNSKMHQH